MLPMSVRSVAIVLGTRPEAIKMAPVIFALKSVGVPTQIIASAQQREMLDQVLELFEIEPDLDLDVMAKDQSLGALTSRLISRLDQAFQETKPSIVLVHGDTSTTFSASLAAFYQKLPVGHVEAGLRTHNIYSPWPEEVNRQLTGRIATWNYAPTQGARKNLLNEGVSEQSIKVTGNTVIDALLFISQRLDSEERLQKAALERLCDTLPVRALNSEHLILVTGHRRENFGPGFERVCSALKAIALEDPNRAVIYPVHLNPHVQSVVRAKLSNIENVYLCEPLQYLEFIYLMKKARLIITDSGGIQEEAPALGIPVLVTRDTTERPEAIEAGTARLVGTDIKKISLEANKILGCKSEWVKMATAVNPFGDGKAGDRIASHLKEFLEKVELNPNR
jgi:UDP-N-acetylglucosamine 2-epimerase (non-hydrolysing)